MFTRHLLVLATMVAATMSYSFAGPGIVRDYSPENSYKVEKPVKEHSAERTVAGEELTKDKEKRDVAGEAPVKDATESGVQYWKYSE